MRHKSKNIRGNSSEQHSAEKEDYFSSYFYQIRSTMGTVTDYDGIKTRIFFTNSSMPFNDRMTDISNNSTLLKLFNIATEQYLMPTNPKQLYFMKHWKKYNTGSYSAELQRIYRFTSHDPSFSYICYLVEHKAL